LRIASAREMVGSASWRVLKLVCMVAPRSLDTCGPD
jgi:hypothetical protein